MNEGLKRLFKSHFLEEIEGEELLKAHASDREMVRLKSRSYTAIGVYNHNHQENITFVEFSRHFTAHSLPVPKIYGEDHNLGIYLEEDLGNDTLYDLLSRSREKNGSISQNVIEHYEKAVQTLPKFQIEVGPKINSSLFLGRKILDKDSILDEMEAFAQNFLKAEKLELNHTALIDDFKVFADFLSLAPMGFFMYRDFQSRNIMVKNESLYFIDYQSALKGPLQYDLISILYQARANLPSDLREHLLKVYLSAISHYPEVEQSQFLKYYHPFMYLHLMHVFSIYGAKGLRGQKQYFIESIPFAAQNLKQLLNSTGLPVKMPELTRAFRGIITKYS